MQVGNNHSASSINPAKRQKLSDFNAFLRQPRFQQLDEPFKAKLLRVANNTTTNNDLRSYYGHRQTFYLNDQITSDVKMEALTEALKTNTTIHGLFFAENQHFNDQSFSYLCEVLKGCRYLNFLDFSFSPITNDQLIYLAEALEVNQSITELVLHGNFIGDRAQEVEQSGCKALGEALKVNQTLKILNLASNNFEDIGIIAIAEGLVENIGLECLFLSGNKITDNGALALSFALSFNRSLDQLNLDGNDIGTNGIKDLSLSLMHDCSIEVLDLGSNKLKSDACCLLASGLASNRSVKTLELSNNRIGLKGSNALGQLLKLNGTITELNVSSNKICPQSMKHLSAGLKENTSIKELNLGHNPIGNLGVQYLLFQLADNDSLIVLNLTMCVVTEIGAYNLLKKNSLKNLKLSNNNLRSDNPDNWINLITNHPSLVSLNIDYTNLSALNIGQLAAALKTNNKLIMLNVAGNQIANHGLRSLQEALHLNENILRFCTPYEVDDYFFRFLLKDNRDKCKRKFDAFATRVDSYFLTTPGQLSYEEKKFGIEQRDLIEKIRTESNLAQLAKIFGEGFTGARKIVQREFSEFQKNVNSLQRINKFGNVHPALGQDLMNIIRGCVLTTSEEKLARFVPHSAIAGVYTSEFSQDLLTYPALPKQVLGGRYNKIIRESWNADVSPYISDND